MTKPAAIRRMREEFRESLPLILDGNDPLTMGAVPAYQRRIYGVTTRPTGFWGSGNVERLEKLWEDGVGVHGIAVSLETSECSITSKARQLGLPPRSGQNSAVNARARKK